MPSYTHLQPAQPVLFAHPMLVYFEMIDRDYILEFLSAASVPMMHMSRLAEELVQWTSQKFGFVRLGRDWVTGSSLLPQKRNPYFAELSRGKWGRVYGARMRLLTTMKSLPMTYDRELMNRNFNHLFLWPELYSRTARVVNPFFCFTKQPLL